MLKDLGENDVLENLFKVLLISSFKDVFPQLPVIAIIFPNEFFLTIAEVFVKKFKLLATLICFELFIDLLILFTIANEAPFLKASFTSVSYTHLTLPTNREV